MKNIIVSIPLILVLLVACDSDSGSTNSESIDDGAAGRLINRENVNDLLLQAFEVYSGRAYDYRLNRFPYESGEVAQCDNEGVTSQSSTSLSFENCAIAGDTVSGSVSQTIGNAGIDRSFQEFTVTFGDQDQMSVSGSHSIACCTPVDDFSTNNLDYLLSYSGSTLRVNNSTTFLRVEADRGVMSGSFSMDPPAVPGHVFDVSTRGDFSFDSGANLSDEQIEHNRTHWIFQSGELSIQADDGSRATVNADTGDEQTLSIAISNADGESTVIESWDEFSDALRWSPGAQLGTFTRDNSVAIINEVFAYYTGHGYVETLHALPGYSDEQYVRGPDLTPTQYGGLVFNEPINVDCSGGGTAAFTPHREDLYRYIAYGWSYDFDRCIDGDNTLVGALSVDAQEIEFTYESAGLSKQSAQGSINYSGKVQYNPEGMNSCPSCTFWTSNELQLKVEDPSSPVHLINGATQFSYNGPGYQVIASLSGGFSINTTATNGQWVHASISEVLKLDYVNDAAHEDESLHNFTIGTLQLRSDDGDVLTLDAGNGDERTATISLSRPGLSSQFTQSWSVWRDMLLPVRDKAPIFAYQDSTTSTEIEALHSVSESPYSGKND